MTPSQPPRSTKPKVIAAIPCYNEECFIGEVVLKAKKHVDQVIVVDDGSDDGSARSAKAAGAVIVNHGVNKGYGESVKSCFVAAKANHADVLVIFDGDGQHNPDELPRALAPILNGRADMVIGSRFLSGQTNIPRYRKFGIDVITWLFNVGSKAKVSDAQSGFRVYSRRILDTISLTEKGMGISIELLVEARRKGFTIQEVPISCSYHPKSSTLDPARHGLGVALTVVKLRSKSLLQGFIRSNGA